MSISPCRKAAFRTVSSSFTSISSPTGSNRTVCRSAILFLASHSITDGGDGRRAGGSRGGHHPSGPALRRSRCVTSARAALLVLRYELLALLIRHVVERDVRTRE